MKKIILACIVVLLTASYASAACPKGTRYQCYPYGKKMACGCY